MPRTTDRETGSGFSLLDGGIVGASDTTGDGALLVAPTAAAEHNTIRAGLIPIACFRVDDVRFAFDSSFVAPGIRAELRRLGRLLDAHPPASLAAGRQPPRAGSPLSVFGHADPSGNDDYNKLLSGRRARAIHALLIRDVDAWNELYTQPHGEKDWGVASIETMLATLGRTGESAKAIDRNAAQRKALFADYMEALCAGAVARLERRDFLAQGRDAKGKGDFQGCGEFNPLLVFSQEKNDTFANQSDHTVRNEANAANRRVMLLIFREGAAVDPARWPCPRADEGVAGCRKRFWSNGEERRSRRSASEDREFPTSEDTFACRFYQRLSDRSPCERALAGLRVRLYDAFERAIALAPFSVTLDGREPTPVARADADGVIALPRLKAPASAVIRWGFAPKDKQPEELLFSRTIFLVPDGDRSEDASLKRLSNLGYDGDDRDASVVGFQLDYGDLVDPALDPSGDLDERTVALIERIYSQSQDDLREL